ncbi:sugar ABC transporter ATP-binding protein [Desulfotomaculum defluvii]
MLKLCNISKIFGNNQALNFVNLELEAGEIHGLVGENGAGKSTLLNILFGSKNVRDTGGYSGEIKVNGEKVDIVNACDAVRYGIGMVHQEFVLLPGMTVAENIKLTREIVNPITAKLFGNNLAYINKKENEDEVNRVFKEELGLSINPRIKVKDLSVNIKQLVEFLCEYCKENLKVLILDEPTAALGKDDANKMMCLLEKLSQKGIAILFVSHRIEEIVSICHKVTILRDGKVVAKYKRDQFNINDIAQSMVGKEVVEVKRQKRTKSQTTILRLDNFSVNMPGESVSNVNLDIYQGEILGLAGLSGHGKLALGNGVMGLFPSTGQACFEGTTLDLSKTEGVIANGIFLVPDERRQSGLLMHQSILNNIIFTALQRKNKFLKSGIWKALSFVNKKHASQYVEQSIKDLDIRCKCIGQSVKHLSGGNQQKVCLARALALEPKLLFISEPTRGIDIGAKELILQEILKINQDLGTTVVVASSELAELKRIADRIAVFFEGKLLF